MALCEGCLGNSLEIRHSDMAFQMQVQVQGWWYPLHSKECNRHRHRNRRWVDCGTRLWHLSSTVPVEEDRFQMMDVGFLLSMDS